MEDKSLEKGLMEYLKYSNVDREKLSDAVRTIVKIADTTQTKPLRVFPKGIPWPDGWGWWNWFDKKDVLQTYLHHIMDNYQFINFDVFPLGIPSIDGWLVESTVGAAKAYST